MNSLKVRMSWSDINSVSKRNVNDVLDSGWISRHKYIPQLEERIAKMHGAKYGIFMNSGTDALRVSLLTLKEVYGWRDGDLVLVPALTFVATVNAILQAGLTPYFVDVDLATGNMKIELSGISSSAVCAVPVHLFGLPLKIPLAWFKIVEDSCETVGVHKLSGDMMCFSFYMSHHISAGVGGMLITNSSKYEKIARSYMNHGRIDDGTHFEFGRVGYSSRATELEAALGCAALDSWPQNLHARKMLAESYQRSLNPLLEHGISLPPQALNHSWMFYPIVVPTHTRDPLLRHLRKCGVESREAMPLINQPVFKELYTPGSCPNAEYWTDNGLLLPLHPQMSHKDVAYVSCAIERFFR